MNKNIVLAAVVSLVLIACVNAKVPEAPHPAEVVASSSDSPLAPTSPLPPGLDSLAKDLPRGEWGSVEGSDIFVKTQEGKVWVINFANPILRHIDQLDPEGNGTLTPVFQVRQLREGCEVWNTPDACYFNSRELTWAQAKAFMSTSVKPRAYATFIKNTPPYLAEQFNPVTVK